MTTFLTSIGRYRIVSFVLIVLLTMVLMPAQQPLSAQTDQHCFPETGYCIEGRIRSFWEQNGGLPVFGYPITPRQTEMIEGNPYQVQWFERNRLELHPENEPPYDVLLGRLGTTEVQQAIDSGVDLVTLEEPIPGCVYSDSTGWNICGPILDRYRSVGLEMDGQPGYSLAENIALFGLPLSPEIIYTVDNVEYTVQLFERARFELHPEYFPPNDVLLGLLGTEALETSYEEPTWTDPCADVPDPVNARVSPQKCIFLGETLLIDIAGFEPNEEVGFWITAPDDSVVGTKETVNIGETGALSQLPIDTSDLAPGLWYIVFEGTSSGNKAIVYFLIIE